MEPKLPVPNSRLERPSVSYGPNLEEQPPHSTPERVGERSQERLEQASDTALQASTASSVLPPPVALPVASPVDSATAPTGDDMPLVASDDDLIEKEWVDKAKKIISETKDDPYRRELEVSKLQADYLRKRYGRELGSL